MELDRRGPRRHVQLLTSVDLRALLADIGEDQGRLAGREYVDGWGVFALPFSSGHVLGLRVFPRNDFAPYVALWHRDPTGRWTIHVDGPRLDTSCPRYFGSACEHTGHASIDLTWTGPCTLRVQMTEPGLDWSLTASTTCSLRVANAISRRLPTSSWTSRPMVRARELMAQRLGLGRIELTGTMPSGHRGRLMPEQMFFIDHSAAVLDGVDLGRPAHLPDNPVIGDFRLPARGVLVKGGAVFEVLDPSEYARTRAEVTGG